MHRRMPCPWYQCKVLRLRMPFSSSPMKVAALDPTDSTVCSSGNNYSSSSRAWLLTPREGGSAVFPPYEQLAGRNLKKFLFYPFGLLIRRLAEDVTNIESPQLPARALVGGKTITREKRVFDRRNFCKSASPSYHEIKMIPRQSRKAALDS